MTMAKSAPWAPLFEGHVANVDTDVLNVVDIEREVIPIILVPGVATVALERADEDLTEAPFQFQDE